MTRSASPQGTHPPRAGRLYGVGVGPGDPGLITLRGADLIRSADVIAYHSGVGKDSLARSIAASLFPPDAVEVDLRYPVTTGTPESGLGYYDAMAIFYEECTTRLAEHLEAGRTVVVLALGDPLFYGSFMYVHDRLSSRFPTEVVPGVTALSASSAAVATGLCRHEDTLTVLSGTLPVPELARRLADTDAAVIMKLGRTFVGVREAIRQAGLTDRAVYVERASTGSERVLPLSEVGEGAVPYMATIVIPGRDLRSDSAGRSAGATDGRPRAAAGSGPLAVTGTVHVVGLGPGPDAWTSPAASEVLRGVDHVVGYAPYVARVPQRAGLARHPSGNTVEVDRGRLALELALDGADVAVVSGGDAGVFGMAAAVFEAAAADSRYATVPVEVVPGITAAHAASALAGAVLGADHALISLSDRLKPWDVLVSRLRGAAGADLAMALYNPRSRHRPDQLGLAQRELLEVLPADRVVVVARDVGREGQSLTVTTLGSLDPETVDMRCIVLIGASSTRVTSQGRVWTPRSVDLPLAVDGSLSVDSG